MSSKFVHESDIRLVDEAMNMSYNFQKEVILSIEFCEKVRIIQKRQIEALSKLILKRKDKVNKYHNSLQRKLGYSLNSWMLGLYFSKLWTLSKSWNMRPTSNSSTWAIFVCLLRKMLSLSSVVCLESLFVGAKSANWT